MMFKIYLIQIINLNLAVERGVLHGVVRMPHKQNDWVFFVTYGQSQSGHEFDGVLHQMVFLPGNPGQVRALIIKEFKSGSTKI